MNITRRSILKVIALSGLAGITMGRGSSLADAVAGARIQTARPTLVLVSGAVEHSAFLEGIAAILPGEHLQVQRTDLGMGFVQNLNQLLRAGQTTLIIGLVDDASAALIVELARVSDARLRWLGHHSASIGQSRHRLLITEAAHDCAAQLGQQLSVCGTGFSFKVQRPHSAKPSLELAAQLRNGSAKGSEQWVVTLGFVLASLGTGQTAVAPPAAATQSPLTGHFVSFAIET